MLGYKATYGGVCDPTGCNPVFYKAGKIYTMKERPLLCHQGFHFCEKLDDVFEYYDMHAPNLCIYLVESLGRTVTKNNKSCTNKLKIIRKLKNNELNRISRKYYIDKYKIIHHKEHYEHDMWSKYDSN